MISRLAYPTDLTDEEWQLIEPLLPAPKTIGHPREVDYREIVNAIAYLLHEGCTWRGLPHDFPAWQTVYKYFRFWQKLGIWENLNRTLQQLVLVQAGKEENPSVAIADSQSVKTTEKRGKYMVMMAGNL